MENLEYISRFEEYPSAEALPASDRELIEHAVRFTENAYAPYSKFFVGAALRLSNGQIITGSNQENVAYPSGLCAERVALFHASSHFPGEAVEAIAITARAEEFEITHPVAPCGSCRQVMAETENRQRKPMRVIMKGHTGKVYATNGIVNLLPFMFQAEELKK
ncbi:MAG: cytidine deaminase [Bacteroidales bacterium]